MDTGNSLKVDKYNRTVIRDTDAINILLEGKFVDNAIFENSEDVAKYNMWAEQILCTNKLAIENDLDITVEEFHKANSTEWDIPDKYKRINILNTLVEQCTTDEELERVATEYIMFEERGMIPMLQFLRFFVDYCREHKYVCGVGRGSSVSSYCLYLMGIHKVNSLAYGLDIKEFLK